MVKPDVFRSVARIIEKNSVMGYNGFMATLEVLIPKTHEPNFLYGHPITTLLSSLGRELYMYQAEVAAHSENDARNFVDEKLKTARASDYRVYDWNENLLKRSQDIFLAAYAFVGKDQEEIKNMLLIAANEVSSENREYLKKIISEKVIEFAVAKGNKWILLDIATYFGNYSQFMVEILVGFAKVPNMSFEVRRDIFSMLAPFEIK